MDSLEKITAVLIAAALFAAWCVWYQASSARVRHCMDHYTACTSAYYQNESVVATFGEIL